MKIKIEAEIKREDKRSNGLTPYSCNTVGASLAAFIEPLAHRQNVASLSLLPKKVASSANHKHANLKTGLMKYLLSVLPIKTSRYHYLGTVEVIVGLNSVFIVKKS